MYLMYVNVHNVNLVSIIALHQVEDEDLFTCPGVSEFVSDAFDACSFNPDDLRMEMRLVLDDNEKAEGEFERIKR